MDSLVTGYLPVFFTFKPTFELSVVNLVLHNDLSIVTMITFTLHYQLTIYSLVEIAYN